MAAVVVEVECNSTEDEMNKAELCHCNAVYIYKC